MFIFLEKFKTIGILILFVVMLPGVTHAATLYFDPAVGDLGPGSIIAVDVLMDVEACINVIEADITYPKEYLQLKDFIVGESVLDLWVERPNDKDIKKANEDGLLNFVGGTPGGYCGKIPGDTGRSNVLARLIFKVPSMIIADEKLAKLNISFLPSTKVLLNDGFGSQDSLTTKIASFNYSDIKVVTSDAWSREIDSDIIPPEPFIVELRKNHNMFSGKYYIIFNTSDKQSGIDRYEVLEIRPDTEIGVVKNPSILDKLRGKKPYKPEWKDATIPYVLEDQELKSTVRVKAIDKAGNERFVEYIPSEVNPNASENFGLVNILITLFVVILIFGLIVFVILFLKRLKYKKNYDKENIS